MKKSSTRDPARWILAAALVLLAAGISLAAVRECRGPAVPEGDLIVGFQPVRKTMSATVAKGRVMDMNADPVVGAQIELFCLGPLGLRLQGKARTDSEGRFSSEVCDGGVLHAFVFAPGRERGHWVWPIKPRKQKEGERRGELAPRILELPDLFLRPGTPLLGLVSSEGGKPIEGALVTAYPEEPETRAGVRDSWPFFALTDERGEFSVEGLRAGSYRIVVRADGYLPAVRGEVDVPGEKMQVSLLALRPMGGKVVFEGKPVEGADVVVAGSGLWPPRRVTTDVRGIFTLPALPPGIYELRARKKDLVSEVLWGVEITEEEAPRDLLLELKQGVRLKVLVVDEETKEGVVGARVTLGHGTLTVAARRQRTDSLGVADIRGVVPGHYFLSAERQGYVATVAKSVEVSLEPDEDEGEAAEGGVGGSSERVSSAEGERAGGGESGTGGESGIGDGGAAERVPEPTTGRPGGRKAREIRKVQVEVVELRKGALLAGQVVDDVGNPVDGARLEIISSARSISAGKLSAGVLESQNIFFQMSGRRSQMGSLGQVPLSAGSGPAGSGPAGTGPGGRPVGVGLAGTPAGAGPAVGGSGDRAAARPAGGLGPGGGFPSLDMEALPSEASEYRALPSQLLAPTAPRRSLGAGLMNLGVSVEPLPPPPLSGLWSTRPDELSEGASEGKGAAWHLERGSYVTDEEGRFRISGLAPGDAVVVISHPDYARFQSRPMRLRYSTRKQQLRFELRPGLDLVAFVGDPQDEPIHGARVVVSGRGDAYHGAVGVTDRKGELRLRNLWGKVRLEIFRNDYVPLVAHVEMDNEDRDGLPQRAEFTLEPANRSMDGYVVDRRNAPLPDATVIALSLDPSSPIRVVSQTDEEGRFELAGLGELDYLVRVLHPERPTREFRGLEVGRTHRLVLGYGGGFSGWARDRQTKALVTPLDISLKPAVGATMRRTFPSGRFEWKGLQSGKYTMTVSSAGYAPVEKDLNVVEADRTGQVTVDDIHLWLELAGKLSGFVRDDRKFPVRGARVWCEGPKYSGSAQHATTDEKGEFVLSTLRPGVCVLNVSHPDKGKTRVPGVVIQSGRVTDEVGVVLSGGPASARAPRSGVAIELRTRGDDVAVSSVRAASSAEKAGLTVGDVVVSVDGETTEGLGLSTIRGLLSGPVGSTVVIEVRRKGRVLRLPVRRELLRSPPGG
jgi:protocatechuate 3,4-dioxygenase beta subunit